MVGGKNAFAATAAAAAAALLVAAGVPSAVRGQNTDTCDIARTALTPNPGDLVVEGVGNTYVLGSGNNIQSDVWVRSGATLVVVNNGTAPAVIEGGILLDGGTFFVAPDAPFEWRQNFNNEHTLFAFNNATLGFAPGSSIGSGNVPHTLAPAIVCDTSTFSYDRAHFDNLVFNPFLLEESSLVINQGTGDLAEISIAENATLFMVDTAAQSINVYFFVNTDTCSGPPITPPANGVAFSGTFSIGTASYTGQNATAFVGGFWIQRGACAVFENTLVALFFQLAGAGNGVSGLMPSGVTPITSATRCYDTDCSIRLGFNNTAVFLWNLYVEDAMCTASDSLVGELSVVGSGTSLEATGMHVDGSGGFVSNTGGSMNVMDSLITTLVTTSSNVVARFTRTTFGPRPNPSDLRPLQLGAANDATLLLSDCPVDPAYTYNPLDNGVIIELNRNTSGGVLDSNGIATVDCGSSAFATLADVVSLAVYRASGASAVSITLQATWTGLASPLEVTVNSASAAAGAPASLNISANCPTLSPTDNTTITISAFVAGTPANAATTTVILPPSAPTPPSSPAPSSPSPPPSPPPSNSSATPSSPAASAAVTSTSASAAAVALSALALVALRG